MKAAKKRHFKKTPEFWKVLQNKPHVMSDEEFWEQMWQLDMQKYYSAATIQSELFDAALKESFIDTCQNKDHIYDLSANIGLTQLPPKT